MLAFDNVSPTMNSLIRGSGSSRQARRARSFMCFHFPLILGIVGMGGGLLWRIRNCTALLRHQREKRRLSGSWKGYFFFGRQVGVTFLGREKGGGGTPGRQPRISDRPLCFVSYYNEARLGLLGEHISGLILTASGYEYGCEDLSCCWVFRKNHKSHTTHPHTQNPSPGLPPSVSESHLLS